MAYEEATQQIVLSPSLVQDPYVLRVGRFPICWTKVVPL